MPVSWIHIPSVSCAQVPCSDLRLACEIRIAAVAIGVWLSSLLLYISIQFIRWQGDDSKNILLAIFRDGGRKTNHLELTEAILDNSNLDQETLEVMLGRVALFGKVFRRLDANGDGQLSLSEIIKMMEMLNIDTKLAADMMAFLDADDSGEVTWQEFVRGVCSNQFKVLFPEITLEALVDLPSSLQWDKFVSEDEQVSAIKGLPTVEKTLYWVLSLMYGSSSHRRISPEDDEDLRSLLHSSDQVVKRLSEKSGRKSGQSGLDTAIANVQEPAQPLTLEREALPSTAPPCMAHVEAVSKGAFAVSDIPALVKTMNQKTVVVVTRKQPKHPSKVQPATLRLGHAFSGTHTIVVRKEAKDPTSAYARPASVQLKAKGARASVCACFIRNSMVRESTTVLESLDCQFELNFGAK